MEEKYPSRVYPKQSDMNTTNTNDSTAGLDRPSEVSSEEDSADYETTATTLLSSAADPGASTGCEQVPSLENVLAISRDPAYIN